jgi:hypothetical protein
MIDGLKLTMTGTQLIAKLDERIAGYEQDARAHRKSAEEAKAKGASNVEAFVRHTDIGRIEQRIDALTLIRDHIVLDEVYRLGEYDLKFADLLPEEEWMDCGCLGRWRHVSDDETAEDDKLLGASAVAGAVGAG